MNKIKLLILDIDGVLTPGNKIYDHTGFCVQKEFRDKDWTAIKLFKCHGVNVCFLTGDPFNLQLANNRDLDCYINKVDGKMIDKSLYLNEICSKYNVTIEDVAYIGDDYFDFRILSKVKYAFVPLDAPNELLINFKSLPWRGGENYIMKFYEHCLENELIENISLFDKINLLYEIDAKEKY